MRHAVRKPLAISSWGWERKLTLSVTQKIGREVHKEKVVAEIQGLKKDLWLLACTELMQENYREPAWFPKDSGKPSSFISFIYVYECFVYMYVCVPCACLVPRRELQISWDWRYRWL